MSFIEEEGLGWMEMDGRVSAASELHMSISEMTSLGW